MPKKQNVNDMTVGEFIRRAIAESMPSPTEIQKMMAEVVKGRIEENYEYYIEQELDDLINMAYEGENKELNECIREEFQKQIKKVVPNMVTQALGNLRLTTD